MPASAPVGENRPLRNVVGPSTSATRPPGPWTPWANASLEIFSAGPKVRPPSVERARKVNASPRFVRGTITSTVFGAGSSTLTRERL